MVYFMSTNRFMDRSLSVEHRVTLVEKIAYPGVDAKYALIVTSWLKDKKNISLNISREVYNAVTENSAIILTTKSGSRGHEWISAPPKIMLQ